MGGGLRDFLGRNLLRHLQKENWIEGCLSSISQSCIIFLEDWMWDTYFTSCMTSDSMNVILAASSKGESAALRS